MKTMAFLLLAALWRPFENVVVSPYSLETALHVAAEGADGATKDEIVTLLGTPNSEEDKKVEASENFLSANSLWLQEGYPISSDYISRIEESYGAEINSVNFASKPDKARKQINSWVEKKTNKKIKDLLQPQHITPSTRLTIVNAVYFLAKWRRPFDKEMTKAADFFLLDGQTVRTKFMRARDVREYYYEDDSIKALRKWYRGNNYSMTFILPKDKTPKGMENLIAKLDESLMAKITSNSTIESVNVDIPKFRAESTIDCIAPLESMGVKTLFSSECDLSKIFGGKKGIRVSSIVQKTFVAVDEDGTEAAAATAIAIMETAMPLERPKKDFFANRPFIWLLCDKPGNVLFAGVLASPSPEE